MARGWAAHSPPGPPTHFRRGEGSPRGSTVQAQLLRSGWQGSTAPYPQEGRSGPKAGHGRTLAHPGPGQTGSKADGGQEAGPHALPPRPPSSLGARYPTRGWKILPGSWASAPTEEGRGSHPGWRDPLAWRQERGHKTGQLLPRREPRGGGQEPRWGLTGERTKSSCSGGGWALCKPLSVPST